MKKTLPSLTLRALLISIALVFAYVEFLLPLPVFLPGMKIGLANIVTIFALYRLTMQDAVICTGLRIFLSSLLFGSMLSLAYSVAGAVCSLLGMWLARKWFSVVGVSVIGGILHNLGQIVVAIILVRTIALAWYFPFLVACGTISGTCIGILAGLAIRRIPVQQKTK